MNPGGVVLIVAALWVGAQVLGGQALERLRLVDSSGRATTAAAAAGPTATATGTSGTPRSTADVGAMTSKYNTGPL